jgi:pyruvate dehydrogenase E1 component
MRRMYQEQETCCFYYVTVMNENYLQPPMVEGSREGIVKGMYRFRQGTGSGKRVQLLGAGAILREALAAADLLEKDFDVSADVWSVTSFNELRREGIAVERWNTLHPEEKPRRSYVTTSLAATEGPIVAATDYIRTYADQIRPYVPRRYLVLGTDGFGRSDTRSQLRRFFEVNRFYIAVAALKALADEGEIPAAVPASAIAKYRIDAEKPNPVTV